VRNIHLAVIKVGGSLFDWRELPRRLEAFLNGQFPAKGKERPLLIAGGGPVVDVVREFDRVHNLGEQVAHLFALDAMGLSARLLSEIVPGVICVESLESATGVLAGGFVPILAPLQTLCAIDEGQPDGLPESWQVTSDSIAARIATYFKASRLILLKSTSPNPDSTRDGAARDGFVDPFFPEAARGLHRVEYLNLRDGTAQLEPLCQ
jgi:aspartokinase-like uncharacterized kinase